MTNIEMYREYLVSNKKSNLTIIAYIADVKQMMEIINKPENEIGFVDFTNWKNSIGDEKPTTINRKIAAARSYFKWLEAMEIVSKNPTEKVENIKIRDNTNLVPAHDYIPMETAKKMISHAKNERDRAIIVVFLSYGFRSNELINLKLSDYVDKSRCVVKTKNDVYRDIIWTEDCKKYIDEYLLVRKESNYDNLFISNQGTPMRENAICATIKNIAARSHIDANICTHSLRHTCISYMVDNYGISQTQKYVKHSSVTITQKYAHNDDGQFDKMAMSVQFG